MKKLLIITIIFLSCKSMVGYNGSEVERDTIFYTFHKADSFIMQFFESNMDTSPKDYFILINSLDRDIILISIYKKSTIINSSFYSNNISGTNRFWSSEDKSVMMPILFSMESKLTREKTIRGVLLHPELGIKYNYSRGIVVQ